MDVTNHTASHIGQDTRDTVAQLSSLLVFDQPDSRVIPLLGGILGTLGLLWALFFRGRKDQKYKQFPGPKGIPWIGPILSLPAEGVYKKFADWHDEYGPVYQLTLFGITHVRINNEKIAHDILAKKGAIYSNRAPTPNIPDAKFGAEYLPLLDNNDQLVRQRKFAHECLEMSYNSELFGYNDLEIKRMMFMFTRDYRNYPEIAEEFTHRIASRLAWENPELSHTLKKSSAGLLAAISPTGQLPNKIPIIMKLPNMLNPWYYTEKRRHDLQREFWCAGIQAVKKKMEQGIPGNSWSRHFLKEQGRLKFPEGVPDDKEGAFAIGMLAITMSLPMSSPIQTYFLAMCHYPHWLRKVQQEIDEVCGPDRLPAWSDAPKLPILRSIGKEIIRWRPPVPTGVPHEAEKDDVYDGYLIKKGTLVHATEWARRSDESLYPNPEEFNPDRYLDPKFPTYKEPLTKYPNVVNHHVFGYGRRICMGMDMVDYQLVTILGALASCFDVSKKKDKLGIDIPVHFADWTDLLITRPATFLFDIKPRNEHKARLIKKMYEEGLAAHPDLAVDPVRPRDDSPRSWLAEAN